MENNLKLLVITHNYPRFEGDYAGVFIALLCKKLVECGITPYVLAPHDAGAPEIEEINGVHIHRFRYAAKEEDQTLAYRGNMHQLVLGSVSGIFKFKQFLDRFRKAALGIIEKENIDVVAGHWLIPAGLVMKTIAHKNKNLPMIMSSHGTDIRLLHKWMNAVYRYLRPFCLNLKRWTVVSSYLKDQIVSVDNRLENVLDVLPLPHDDSVFYRTDENSREKKLIVSVTRFTEQKRVNYLIKAMALLSERCPNARLEIYGTGPLQNEIEQLIKKFGLGACVSIHEPISQVELRKVYNRASVVVLNSFQEGFGLSLSEAMLCGASVVGTRSGGITDIIKHEQTGLLVDVDDSASLADAVVRLLEDDQLRTSLAESGHTYAREHYAAGSLAEKYAEIIRQAASDRKA